VWQADEPTGFAKLRTAPQTGTWNLWVRDLGPTDVGPVTAWSIVTKDNNVTWSGPAGFTATGSSVLATVPTAPGRYEYIGVTRSGTCTFRDTVRVRVATMLATRKVSSGVSVEALPVPFGTAGFALQVQAARPVGASTVSVYDLAGRLLLQRAVNVPAGASTITLAEAGRLAAGVYLVRATIGGETQTLRLSRE
jgi:hypothetical protein